jgi:caa(3)-type oxidase subunit IV
MADTPEEIVKERKRYWLVGYILFGCTAATLILGINLYHNFGQVFDLGEPGIGPPDVILALSIAAFKSSLVCLIFMHLNHERGIIYKFLLFTVCFLISLMGLTLFARLDPIKTAIQIILPQYS